ncbi:hypothetical protein ACFLQY_02210 [Verrucomicrobiota bacterium]
MLKNMMIVSVMGALLLTGCSTYRAIPSHGGGKRFDEEQRVVAASIRRAVAQLDLSTLKGKKVKFMVQELEHSGGGELTPAGLSDVNFVHLYDYKYLGKALDVNEGRSNSQYKPDTDLTWTGHTKFKNQKANTDKDVKYLKSILTMWAECNGIEVVKRKPEVIVTILVDVFGTNCSTLDGVLYVKDTLRATTEFTYYLEDAKTSEVLTDAKQVAGVATYSLHTCRFANITKITRDVDDEVRLPYLRPTL